ncbi:MAG TPA: ABC transporter permease [Polyangiaceae bacterium]|jgi:putative ABC transport system permease protein
MIFGAFLLALSAIARNKTRAVLTVLGILIGITAVIIVTALAESTSSAVADKIDSMSANALYVWPQPVQASGAKARFVGRLTENDGRAIAREAVSAVSVAPWLVTQGQVVYGDKNWSTTIAGVTLPYYQVRRFTIARGENWTESDELLKTKVCVIGQTVATNLFGTDDPIGRTIRVGRSPYRVIGLLTPRGSGTFGEDQDDRVMMPIGSYRARVVHTSPGRVDELMISAATEQTVDRAKAQIQSILRQRHHIDPGARDDFEIRTQADMRATTDAIFGTLSALGIAVAAISLLVGGVGVMNIMLVSVAERTREIGIRMSIGARERDILVQFLVEAVVLTLIGGLLGILVGSAGAIGIGRALDMAMVPTAKAIGVAVATSLFIGTIFGFLPAWRAAKLDPIAALRVE